MTVEKKQILYKWLNQKYNTYEKSEYEYYLYLYYRGNKRADILIEKKRGFIIYDTKLYKEFYEIIPLEYLEFEGFMSKWGWRYPWFKGIQIYDCSPTTVQVVGDTFGLKGFTSRVSVAW